MSAERIASQLALSFAIVTASCGGTSVAPESPIAARPGTPRCDLGGYWRVAPGQEERTIGAPPEQYEMRWFCDAIIAIDDTANMRWRVPMPGDSPEDRAAALVSPQLERAPQSGAFGHACAGPPVR